MAMEMKSMMILVIFVKNKLQPNYTRKEYLKQASFSIAGDGWQKKPTKMDI